MNSIQMGSAIFLVVSFGLGVAINIKSDPCARMPASQSPQMCRNLLGTPHGRPSFSRRQDLGLRDEYFLKGTLERRLSPIIAGRVNILVSNKFWLGSGIETKVSTITKMESRSVPEGMEVQEFSDDPELWKEAMAALEFVIETYRERRPHWTPEFLAKLRTLAIEYLKESTYINIRNNSRYLPQAPMASIRVIRERDGLLPMERYLGIQVDVGGKLKMEPGNFAIERSVNEEAWPELLLHLIGSSVRNAEPGRENHYITYADEYSLALYSRLGFRPVPPSRMTLNSGVEMKDGKILANGIWWTPMEATQATLDGLLQVHLTRLERRGADSEELQALLQRRDKLAEPPRYHDRQISGRGEINGISTVGRIELHTQHDFVRILFRSNDLEMVSLLGVIEKKFLPLKDVVRFDDSSNRISYTNGLFVLERNTESHSRRVEIRTTPDFSVVTSLRIEHQVKGEEKEIVNFHF